ncbi:coatomer epsilon subunit-domain-containing protein [Dipodascopsis uninucleata]
MDPFSDAGELFTIHNLFYQGAYKDVIQQPLSGYSDTTVIQARIYYYRAQIALGNEDEVIAELADTEGDAGLAAVKALALYKSGSKVEALDLIQELADIAGDDGNVQVLGATILYLEGKVEDALLLLSKHEANLAAVSLIVQIRLQQNQLDLAVKEVQMAKKWGQDNLLVNLPEAWVCLQKGGDKYQDAFYIYEELSQIPSSSNARTLIGQAIADIQLGRLPEAEDAINAALEKDATNPDVLVNAIVLYTLLGKDYSEFLSTLESTDPSSSFLQDLQAKRDSFDEYAAQYSALVIE